MAELDINFQSPINELLNQCETSYVLVSGDSAYYEDDNQMREYYMKKGFREIDIIKEVSASLVDSFIMLDTPIVFVTDEQYLDANLPYIEERFKNNYEIFKYNGNSRHILILIKVVTPNGNKSYTFHQTKDIRDAVVLLT